METITYANLQTTLIVIVTVIGAIVVIMNFVDKIRAWRKPATDKDGAVQEALKSHENRLNKDHERITRLENDIHMTLRIDGNILEHMITGNSVEKMRKTHADYMDYMTKR